MIFLRLFPFIVCTFNWSCAYSATKPADDIAVSKSVLTRLTNVEDIVNQLQNENKKLRLENRDLAEKLKRVETVCRVRDVQMLFMKKKLKQVEIFLKKTATIERNNSRRHSTDSDKFSELREKQTDNPSTNAENVQHSEESTKTSSTIQDSMPRIRRSPNVLRIAFSAHTSFGAQNMGTGQKLLFPNVNANEGGGYDKQTGVFICPVAGTYLLEATVTSWHDSEPVYSEITVNGNTKAKLLSHVFTNSVGQSSNSVIVHLNQGDHVWVEHTSNTTGSSNIIGDRYSHFGGFILWAN